MNETAILIQTSWQNNHLQLGPITVGAVRQEGKNWIASSAWFNHHSTHDDADTAKQALIQAIKITSHKPE